MSPLQSPFRAVAVALTLASLAACAPEGETEVNQQEVATTATGRDQDVYVGRGIWRQMRIGYGTKCVEWEYRVIHKGSPPQRWCKRMGLDDSVWRTATLHESPFARDNGWIFPALSACGVECASWATRDNPKGYGPRVKYCTRTRNVCSSQLYKGCGPAAAANVLKFYGVDMSTTEVADRYVETFEVPPFDGIATTPDSLARGLERLLNENADGIFTVTRKSYADIRSEVQNAIRKGTPIIVLVNNGNHYVTVTGFTDWSLFNVSDYYGSERQVNDWDLDTGNLTGDVLGWVGGFLPYTVITIDRRDR